MYSSSLKDSEEAYYGDGYIRPTNQDGLVITNFWDSSYYAVRQYLFTDDRILCRHRGGQNKAGFDTSKYTNWIEIGIDSIGDNYIRYTNGIQICWGSPSASSSVGYCYITFPQAFSVIPTVMGSATNSDEYKDANYAQNIRVVSKTGCTVNDWMLRGTAQKFNYIAIGKWK